MLLMGMLLAAGCSTAGPSFEPSNPKTLMGTWVGQWRTKFGSGVSNQYALTIESVLVTYINGAPAGAQVSGHVEYREYLPGGGSRQFRFRGTLAGDQLTYRDTTLVVDGATMSGTWRTGLEIKLTKQQ